MSRITAFLPAAILAVGCGFIWQTHTQREVPLVAPLTTVLPKFEDLNVLDVRISDEERRVAGMSDYIARVYARDSLMQFSTLVSYYTRQSQGKTIHSPRNCLPGAGWEILRGGRRTLVVDGVAHEINQYTLKNGASVAIAYYWYQGRGRIVASEYAVKWNLLRDAALAGHTEEALVRVVVPVTMDQATALDSAATDRAYAKANALGDTVASALMKDVVRVLPGSSPLAGAL
jgi:EpsI family protein